MHKASDIHQQALDAPLTSNGVPVAYTKITYDVRRYLDLRGLKQTRRYVVKCTQRIMVPNPSGYTFGPGPVTQFNDYPALLDIKTSVDERRSEPPDDIEILGYSPKTLNASVSTSSNASDSSNSSDTSSREHTSGSSTSTTNSYGCSANVGFFGDTPTGGISGNYEYSSTSSHSQSSSTGQSHTSDEGHTVSGGTDMTIKDWGSYAICDPATASIEWVWGQEFPWNVIQFKNVFHQDEVSLPAFVTNRLWDGKSEVYPPSELSLFGVNFVSSVSFLVTPNAGNAALDKLVFDHDTQLCKASHGIDSHTSKLFVHLDEITPPIARLSSPVLDLDLLALDPVISLGEANGAETGFVQSKFIVAPDAGAPFKTLSDANNLLVMGSGFNRGMTVDYKSGEAKLTIYFKILDINLDHTLTMKHYKTTDTGSVVTIVINDADSSAITRYVDADLGDGGDGNFTRVRLRNKDILFDEYYDYLVQGMNKIEITVSPSDGKTGAAATAGYVLRGLAID